MDIYLITGSKRIENKFKRLNQLLGIQILRKKCKVVDFVFSSDKNLRNLISLMLSMLSDLFLVWLSNTCWNHHAQAFSIIYISLLLLEEFIFFVILNFCFSSLLWLSFFCRVTLFLIFHSVKFFAAFESFTHLAWVI